MSESRLDQILYIVNERGNPVPVGPDNPIPMISVSESVGAAAFVSDSRFGQIIYTVDVNGNPVPVGPNNPLPMLGDIGGGGTSVAWSDITGKPSVIAAGLDAASARAVLGVTNRAFFINGTITGGSSSLVPAVAVPADLGVDTSGTIARVDGSGRWAILGQIPTWSTLAGKPTVIAAGADAATARAIIGAGTSNLSIGTTSTSAKAGDYVPSSAEVSTALAAKAAISALTPIASPASATVEEAVTLLNAIVSALKS